LSDHQNSVKSSPKSRKWHFRDSKFKNFLWSLALEALLGMSQSRPARGGGKIPGARSAQRGPETGLEIYLVDRTAIQSAGLIFGVFWGKFSNFGIKN
jgi:hypothetical protein